MCFNYYRFDNKIGEAISHTWIIECY
jgi:hypothetical protein